MTEGELIKVTHYQLVYNQTVHGVKHRPVPVRPADQDAAR